MSRNTELKEYENNTTGMEKMPVAGRTDRPTASVRKRAYEEWSKAGIGNAFLFGKVMTANPDLLLELLQYSLPEFHIRKIEEVEKEVEIRLSIDAHGVRLDILTSDDKGRYIDVEMQMKDEKNIPHRMRYYESAIDQINLERGMDYTELGDMIIMFITPFDPFQNRGLYRYTFRTLCLEDRELEMQDGVTKVVLNANGREGEISTELKGFLQLVAGSTNCAEGTFAARVQSQVVKARQNARWRKEFMDWEMTLRHEREKGREEGRQEERANTERERKRADEAQAELQQEKQRADQYQTEVDRLRRLLAEHGVSDVSNGAS